ncbi:hypothetical protein HDU76_005427, partial [Blyttiomyces sp. JEL0837]
TAVNNATGTPSPLLVNSNLTGTGNFVGSAGSVSPSVAAGVTLKGAGISSPPITITTAGAAAAAFINDGASSLKGQQQQQQKAANGVTAAANTASAGAGPATVGSSFNNSNNVTGAAAPSSVGASSLRDIPQDAIDELLDLYFMYGNPILANIVHEGMFRATLEQQSPLLLCSMYAVAARWSRHPAIAVNPEEMYSAGDVFYSKARILVSKAIDIPSLDTIAALIMLVTYASGSGRASASWMYSGLAIRMAQSLKLDLDPDFQEVQDLFGPLTWFEKEQRRRLWASCFIMDRYTASAADRSMLVLEKDAKVFPPVPTHAWLVMGPNDREPIDGSFGGVGGAPGTASGLGHSPWQLALLSSSNEITPASGISHNIYDHYVSGARIYGRVMEYTGMLKNPSPGLPGAALVTMADAEYKMTSIEQSLRDWLAALPEWIRNPPMPTDPSKPRFSPNWTRLDEEGQALVPTPWDVCYLLIFHHTSVVMLHRPKMMAYLQSGDPARAMRSPSFLASQQAASSVSGLLEEVMESNPDFYWFTPFVAFCIFQTSLVHVVAAQTLSSDAEAVARASQRVRTHLRALKLVSRYWLQGVRLAGLLEDLFSTVERHQLELFSGDVNDEK